MMPADDSEAVDAGDDGFTIDLRTDQRGNGYARRLGTAVDLGAVERKW